MNNNKDDFYKDLAFNDHYKIAKKYNQSINLLRIIEPKETAISKLLAWLLNPNEAHCQNDLFLREFLKIICLKNEQMFQNIFKMGIVDLDMNSLPNFIIYTEELINVGRLDIVLKDIKNNALIIIENKFGAKEHGDQLSKYDKYVTQQQAKNKTKTIKVVLDYYEQIDLTNKPDWIMVNYDWLIKILKILVNAPEVPQEQLYIFKSLYDYFADEYNTFDYFKDVEKSVDNLAAELLEKKYCNKEIDEAIEELENKYPLFYLKNEDLLDRLQDSSFFIVLAENIKKKHSDLIYEPHVKNLGINPWSKFMKNQEERWPMYLSIQESDTAANLFNIMFFFYHEYVHADYQKVYEEILIKIKGKYKGNSTSYRYLMKDVQKDILQFSVEGFIGEINSYARFKTI